MNAERDVQRLITTWLAEEAEVRAPDRVLDSARRAIDRTPQRRSFAAWREPMYVSPLKLATAAAVMAVAVVGAAVAGRVTAPGGVGGQPLPTAASPAATAEVATVESYRLARDEICERYTTATEPLRAQFENLYDAAETSAQRAPKIAALDDFASQYDRMIDELAALEAHPAAVDAHAANVARLEAVASLIHGIVDHLRSGDLVGAESLDLATDPITAEIERYEGENSLIACP
jgi:hypothetical protein